VRRTFDDLATATTHPSSRALLLDAETETGAELEIAVVYFRAGYTPADYPTPAAYATRTLLERSRAIQCPSLALQLAGAKIVQEALARPGVLARFCAPRDAAVLRESWVSMWALDAAVLPPGMELEGGKGEGEGEPAGVRAARANAPSLVLKPQREGGGNNVYHAAIPAFLSALPAREHAAWIAMSLIAVPEGVGGYLVRGGAAQRADEVVSELGVFGWALFGAGEVREESGAGWLVRTKGRGVDEGGVAAGFSVLDSVVLVD
jgi:glutathione synthase